MKKQMTMLVCVAALLIMAGCGKNPVNTTNNYYQGGPQFVLVGSVSDGVSAFAINSDYLFAATNSNYGGIYRSADNGVSWTSANGGLPTNIYYGANISLVVNGNYIFTRTLTEDTITYSYHSGVYRSSDNGTSWTPTGFPNPDTIAVSALTANGSYVFAATQYYDTNYTCHSGVYRSSDNGTSWTPTGFPNPDTVSVTALAANSSYLFAAIYYYDPNNNSDHYRVYRSSDNGASWIKVDTQFQVNTFAVSGNTFFAWSNYGGLYRSTDNGTNWTNTSLTTRIGALTVNGNNVFAATQRGVFLSTDNGATWTVLGGMYYNTLMANSDYLFAAYYSEIWRMPLAGL